MGIDTAIQIIILLLLANLLPGLLLTNAGKLFDGSMYFTLIHFGETINPLLEIIKIIWTAGRDITNILIIGAFVYIAISKILSINKNFNKAIVQLLLVATLINFSFFFAQVPIDISNWTTIQVYNSIIFNTDKFTSDTQSLSEIIKQSLEKQIPQQNALGVPAPWDFVGILATIGSSIANILPTLGLFFVWVIEQIVIALLFFRISIILITRWITLVLLMATSSLGFATMLIPGLKSYWRYWYKGLVYNSIIAPLLLFLLWGVTLIIVGLRSITPTGNATLYNYLTSFLSIGLLWAAIRVSTIISEKATNSAGGLGKYVNKATGYIQGLGVRAGASSLSFAGRNTLGRGFSKMGDRLENIAGGKRFANSTGLMRLAGDTINSTGKQLNKIGKSGFDIRTTKAFKNVTKNAGLDSKAIGSGIKDGFEKIEKRKEQERKASIQKADKTREEEIKQKLEAESEINRARQEEIKDLEKQNSQNAKQVRDNMSQASQLQNEATKEKAEKTNKEEERNILKGEVERVEKEIETKKTEKSQLEEARKTGSMRKEGDKINKLSEEIANLEERREDGRNKLEILNSSIDNLDTSISTKESRANELTQEANLINPRLRKLYQEDEEFSRLVDTEVTNMVDGLSMVTALEPDSSKDSASEQIARLEQERTELQERLNSTTNATSDEDKKKDSDKLNKVNSELAKLHKYNRVRKEQANKFKKNTTMTKEQIEKEKKRKAVEDALFRINQDPSSQNDFKNT